MATIEINLEVYNNLLSKLEESENQLNEDRKTIQSKDSLIEALSENVDILTNTTLYDRVFGWNKIKKLLNPTNKHNEI